MSATSAPSIIRRTTHGLLATLAGLMVALGLQVVTVGGAEAYTISSQGDVSSTQRPRSTAIGPLRRARSGG